MCRLVRLFGRGEERGERNLVEWKKYTTFADNLDVHRINMFAEVHTTVGNRINMPAGVHS